MPNIKSAKKRVLVNENKTELNKNIRSAVKTAIKKVDQLVKEGNLEGAKVALNEAFKAIDSATSKNIFHKNNASNKKAKLAKKVNACIPTSKEEVKKEEKIEEKVEAVEVKEEVKPAKKTVKKTAEKEEKPAEKKPAVKKTTAKKTATKKAE